MFLYIISSSALGGRVVCTQCPMTGKLQLSLIIPSALLRRHRRSAGLVRRPIAFEEPLSHHPQKSTRMLAVYALVVDDDFDMRRTRYSTGHTKERLFVAQVAANREGHRSGPDKTRTTSRLIEPSLAVRSLMQINGPRRRC